VEFVGLRVLLVEDELLVAMMLEEVLRSEGCVIVGPVPRVEQALTVARDAPIDAAVLDVNLAGERVFPIADVLAERNVPFLFMTGYGRGMLPAKYAHLPALAKPFRPTQLIGALSSAVDDHCPS
jgi:DNA-binding response OmpR family regulator